MSLFHVAEITLLPACRPAADVPRLANSILISTITTPQPSRFSVGQLFTLERWSLLPVYPPLSLRARSTAGASTNKDFRPKLRHLSNVCATFLLSRMLSINF